MSDWTAGYVADIGYTYGYYSELNPLKSRLAILSQGYAVPEFGTACELGFGQGLSINIHAAASQSQWHGTDFNPSQAAHSQHLAKKSESDIHLYDESFEDFIRNEKLPDFDFIGLHGIWSWVGGKNREIITNFIQKKLKIGGVLYISYNTLPGWSAFSPVRHLLSLHSQVMSGEGQGSLKKVDASLEFVDKIWATDPAYIKANPVALERYKKVKEQNRNYIAHEYFNRDWLPMHFSDMAEFMHSAKMQYVCSAHYNDHIGAINVSEAQRSLMQETSNQVIKETMFDYFINQQFRRDYWIKGARKLNKLEQLESLRAEKFVLVVPREDVPLTVNGPAGTATLTENLYTPILDFLADFKPKTLGQIESAMSATGLQIVQIVQCVIVLVGTGSVSAVQSSEISKKILKSTNKINFEIIKKACENGDIGYLASPLTGGGVMVGRFNQIFLLAYIQGKKTTDEWAEFAWAIIRGLGQALLKDGAPMQDPKDNFQELKRQAEEFSRRQFPVLRSLLMLD